MTQITTLTKRDLVLLLALVQKVRAFSLRQTARHWWAGDMANARRRLKMLAESEFLRLVTVSARSLPPLQTPVIVWQPGQAAPDFGKIAYQLKLRWKHRPARLVTTVVGTARSARLLGGKARGDLKCGTQATHDLGVAAVWLRLHAERPAWAAAWRGEDVMAHTRRNQKLPDAFIVNGRGEPVWIIEFGGAYDAARVKDFHSDCADRSLPYEMW